MQSRKRQCSKKSAGSVSSKKSPEYQSQLDDTGNSAAEVLVEPPNGTHCWPISAHSSTGNLGSLEDGSCNNMQGLAPLSENQNFVRTLPGSAAWSLQTEVESVQSIPSAPPPTDIGGVPDPNGSLWPLFPTDTDWQFDFDDQLTTEPNTTFISAASIAVNELDLSQSYNHPTLGSESAGLSRNLIEYLSLSEKVSSNPTILTSNIIFYTYICELG